MSDSKLLPETGLSAPLALKSMVKEMGQDIIPHRNLGSFISTHHSEIAAELISASFHKNQACVEEYESISEYRERCISILAHLWNKAEGDYPIGDAATGSSEAIILAGLAMKRAWEEKTSTDDRRPNIIIGSNAHACVFKFATYFGVEARVVPVSAATHFVVDKHQVAKMVGKDTVGVFLTLGNTYTGHFVPVMDVAGELEKFESRTGHFVPIHIDAASGGFVAPFDPTCKGLVWDFRIRQVQSINASGHKFGFSACTVGWIVWRDVSCVPDSLIMESSYLRGSQSAYTLSFSRSQAPIVVQYFNFLHLGDEGYREKVTLLLSASHSFSHRLDASGMFECISPHHQMRPCNGDICSHGSRCRMSEKYKAGLPVVVFTLSRTSNTRSSPVQLSDLSNWMFEKGFSIPHYSLPKYGVHEEDINVLRIVVREDVVPQLSMVYEMLIEGMQRLWGNS